MAWFYPTFDLGRAIGEDRLQVEAATVGELIDRVIERYGEPAREATRSAYVLVDGRSISLLKGRRTRLSPDSEVWMVRASAGG